MFDKLNNWLAYMLAKALIGLSDWFYGSKMYDEEPDASPGFCHDSCERRMKIARWFGQAELLEEEASRWREVHFGKLMALHEQAKEWPAYRQACVNRDAAKRERLALANRRKMLALAS